MNILPPSSNFLAIEEQYSSIENSQIVILPAPYEYRVSYGRGTALAPEKILEASAYVEFYDDEFKRELCFEKGIATLEPINFTEKYDEAALEIIKIIINELLKKDKFIVTLGGEHTISSAPIEEHLKKYPDMCVLQFDAHSDLRDSYEGSKYSHASVMARVAEILPPQRITQVGIRALCKEEAEFIEKHKVKTFFASGIRKGIYGNYWQDEVVNTLSKQVYITFDVDYFDPCVIPATGTPEPDGFFYNETLDLFRLLIEEGKEIIGLDVVELAPIENLHHPQLTTARLIYKIMNFAFAKQ